MNRRILVLALGPGVAALLLLRPTPTTALEPANASSVIELNSDLGSGTTHCPFGGVAADSVNKPDATRASGFTVPARRVLVVTDVEFFALNPGPGNLITFTLARETSGAINWINSNISATTGLDGATDARLSLRGAIVKSGVTLCVQCFDHSTHGLIANPADCGATIHGFLANDS